MIHRTRVSFLLPVLATMLTMLMVSFAASAYYGAIENDMNAWPLTILAAFGCGAPAWLLVYIGWQGMTINVGNCPAVGGALPGADRWYPEIEDDGQFQQTVAVYHADDGMSWMVNYSTSTWRAAAKVLANNRDRIPQRQAEAEGINRGTWERLKRDLVDANLAIRRGRQLLVNEAGKRVIYRATRGRK